MRYDLRTVTLANLAPPQQAIIAPPLLQFDVTITQRKPSFSVASVTRLGLRL